MKVTDVRYDFVPMGAVLEPRAGVIAVDVGNKCIPGVIDHHFVGAGEECAASLVATREDLVLQHLKEAPSDRLTILMHREPDLDCLVAAHLVRALAMHGELPVGAAALAEYARAVDAGHPPPDGVGPSSLWALYAAAAHLTRSIGRHGTVIRDEDRYRAGLMRGFALLDLILEKQPRRVARIQLPQDLPGWEAEQNLLREHRGLYDRDRENARVFTLRLPGPGGSDLEVRGIAVTSPRSALFKPYSRAEGFVFTHVFYPSGPTESVESVGDRHVIAVAPERGVWLRGLGKALEAREVLVRAELGEVRGGEARWPDVTNADPWYDGRSPLHAYTIVDAPRQGTILSKEQVEEVVCDTRSWIPLGKTHRGRICPEGCILPDTEQGLYCPRHGAQLVPPVIAGRYEVDALLGKGAMGVVYLVQDRYTAQDHALKVTNLSVKDARLWEAFVREARLANRVGHPHVVRLYDFGADSSAGLFMVSEYVVGPTLEEDLDAWLDQGLWYPWPRMKLVLQQICEALSAIHSVGVLHRDLKPSNIMLSGAEPGRESPTAHVKVMDFGIAILASAQPRGIVKDSDIIATPDYASPEHLQGRPVDERTDLYGLGVIFYELLCGRTPFGEVEDLDALLNAKITLDAPPLEPRHPILETVPRIEQLLFDLLRRDPGLRPAAAKVVGEMLVGL